MKITGSGPKAPLDSSEKTLKKDSVQEKAPPRAQADSSQLNLSRSLKAIEELTQSKPEIAAQAQRPPSRESVELLLNHLDSGKGQFSRASSRPQEREAALSFLDQSATQDAFSFAEAFSALDSSRVAKLLED